VMRPDGTCTNCEVKNLICTPRMKVGRRRGRVGQELPGSLGVFLS
jgi:hypothetical protein